MNQKPSPANLLQLLPTKWAIVLVVGLILYALLQPLANRTFGWRLPSLSGQGAETASSKEEVDPPSSKTATKQQSTTQESGSPKQSSNSKKLPTKEDPKGSVDSKTSTGGSTSEGSKIESKGKTSREPSKVVEPTKKEANTKPTEKTEPTKRTEPIEKGESASSDRTKTEASGANKSNKGSNSSSSKKFGLLSDVGRDRYESPAGLIYGPGSEEGHRLKHVERHTEDQPNRPSKHGVFDGGMESALKWIDDGYLRASKGAKGTSKRNEEGRMVYEASFDKPIGFIGGRDGKRAGNPPAKRVRIVVDGKNVITAFPF